MVRACKLWCSRVERGLGGLLLSRVQACQKHLTELLRRNVKLSARACKSAWLVCPTLGVLYRKFFKNSLSTSTPLFSIRRSTGPSGNSIFHKQIQALFLICFSRFLAPHHSCQPCPCANIIHRRFGTGAVGTETAICALSPPARHYFKEPFADAAGSGAASALKYFCRGQPLNSNPRACQYALGVGTVAPTLLVAQSLSGRRGG